MTTMTDFLLATFVSLIFLLLKVTSQAEARLFTCATSHNNHNSLISSATDNGTIHLSRNRKWPDGVLPYQLHSSLTDKDKKEIKAALREYHLKTCVRFIEKTPFHENYVSIEYDFGNCGSAQRCMQGGYQYARFGKHCRNKQAMVHELGHTLCLSHEHERSDRDKWLLFEENNCTHVSKKVRRNPDKFFYDYHSQMHYQCNSCYGGFPRDKFVKKCGIDVTTGLSVLDADHINKLYDCQGCLRHRWIAKENMKLGDMAALHSFKFMDLENNPLFPCRGFYRGHLLVGKAVFSVRKHSWKSCVLPFGNKEYSLTENFEILTIPGNLTDEQSEYSLVGVNERWSKEKLDQVFKNAIIAGHLNGADGSGVGNVYIAYSSNVVGAHYCSDDPKYEHSLLKANVIGSIKRRSEYYESLFPLCGTFRANNYYVLSCERKNQLSNKLSDEFNDEDSTELVVESGTNSETFKLNDPIVLAAGIALLLSLLLLTAVLIYNCRVAKTQSQILRHLSEGDVMDFVQGSPNVLAENSRQCLNRMSSLEALPFDQKYEISLENIAIDHSCLLGTGEYGEVYKGKIPFASAQHYLNMVQDAPPYVNFPQDVEVAVKTCKGSLNKNQFKALLTEMKVMAYLGSHENIVNLIGVSTENIQRRELYIAVEYCPKGSLDDFIQNKKHFFTGTHLEQTRTEDYNLTHENLYTWSFQIADGLKYIHEKKVVHGDLAIRNIMLTQDLTAKIGDFGLSRLLVRNSIYKKTTDCALPWRNMAIESLANMEFSTKSDIWAFGITLWELFTLGETPYQGISYSDSFVTQLQNGHRLGKPPLANEEIYEYMKSCWQKNPMERPDASQIQDIDH